VRRLVTLAARAEAIALEAEHARQAARATAVAQEAMGRRYLNTAQRRGRTWADIAADAQALRETWQEYRWTGEFVPTAGRVLGPGWTPPPPRQAFHRLATDRCEVRGPDGQWVPATEGRCGACVERAKAAAARVRAEADRARWAPSDEARRARRIAYADLIARLEQERRDIEADIRRLEREHDAG
jgi:hypothetical protein